MRPDPSAPEPAPDQGPAPMTHHQILEALWGLLLVLFVALLSTTIVSTGLPSIIEALHGTQTQYTWVVTAALLSATASTPIWGKLADLFRKKTLILTAIGVFVVGSLLCGVSQSAGQLIAARFVQGLGVGGLQALVQAALASMIAPRERGRYNGYMGGVMALATVSGPLLGGLVVDTDQLGWRWTFFLGVPVALVAAVILQRTLRLPEHRRDDVRVDVLGATVITAAVSLLLVWVSFVDDAFAWVSWQSGAMVAGTLVLTALAVVVERRAREAVVPPHIVRTRTAVLAILASLSVGVALMGASVFLGQYFQVARGYSPTGSGLLTIPLLLGVFGSSIVVGRLVTRTGRIKPFVVTGAVLLTCGYLALATTRHGTSLWAVGAGMAVVGVGAGMTMQNLVLSVQNTVQLKDMGAASATVSFFRSLGGTIGVAVLGAVLSHRVQAQVADGLAALGVTGATAGSSGTSLDLTSMPDPVADLVRAAYGDATGHIFLISAVLSVVGILATLALPASTLRSTVDAAPAPATPSDPPVPVGAAPTGR